MQFSNKVLYAFGHHPLLCVLIHVKIVQIKAFQNMWYVEISIWYILILMFKLYKWCNFPNAMNWHIFCILFSINSVYRIYKIVLLTIVCLDDGNIIVSIRNMWWTNFVCRCVVLVCDAHYHKNNLSVTMLKQRPSFRT